MIDLAHALRTRNPPRINVWREPVDENLDAVIACCRVVQRGSVYGSGAFILVRVADARSSWKRQEIGQQALLDAVGKRHAGFLPYLGEAW